jgi:rhomboid protease GluP
MRIFRILIITNAAVFAALFLLQTLVFRDAGNLNTGLLYQLFNLSGGVSPYDIAVGKYWTLVTANFVHLDIIHFAFNFYALIKIGQIVYEFYDGKKLFIVYMLGGLGGMALSVGADMFLGTNTATLGASGSIFALAGVLIGGALKDRRYGINLPINLTAFLPIIIASLVLGFLPGSGINNLAHLGGIVTGMLLGLVLKHEIGDYESARESRIVDVLYYVLFGVFILSFLLHIMYVITLFS